jgi:hypothetical protein
MLKTFLGSLLNIIFPKTCLVCHRPLKDNNISDFLCLDCWTGIKKNARLRFALFAEGKSGEFKFIKASALPAKGSTILLTAPSAPAFMKV